MDRVRTPLTLVAGWHGSGKSRLVERIIIGYPEGPLGAVVPAASRFAEGGYILKTEDEVVEQAAGCQTCAIRFDLLRSVRHLVRRRLRPAHIVVELTGWADASTAAQTILSDPYLARMVELDALVTVVDAEALLVRASSGLSLWPAREAAEQVVLADVVVLNRVTGLTGPALAQANRLIAQTNRLAEIVVDDGRSFDPTTLLGVGAYEGAAAKRVGCLHEGTEAPAGALPGAHLVEVNGELDSKRFEQWLKSLDHTTERRMLRVVGVVAVAGEEQQILCQRVGTYLDLTRGGPWNGPRITRLFVCGRHLTVDAIRSGLQNCVNV